MKRTLALLLLLTGCADAPSVDDVSRRDVRGTASSIATIAAQVQGLAPAQRDQATASLQVLSATCPYTHAALQLAFALHHEVARIPSDAFDPLVQQDWDTLQQGLATHVAVLAELGVDNTLATADDPMDLIAQQISQITTRAAAIDNTTAALIHHHSDQVEAATGITRPCPRGPTSILPGQPWTLGMQLGGWHDALRRVRPFATDAHVVARIDAMADALHAFGEASFVSGTPALSTP